MRMTQLRKWLAAAVVATGTGLAGPAAAQQPEPVDIEVPAVVTDTAAGGDEGGGSGSDEQLDLANVVQSAAKGVTTVQEAPVIVTVVTSDEIRERQFQTLDQILDTIPGYQRIGVIHSQFPSVNVRGNIQAVQLLHDSVSMFDPLINVASFGRVMPVELIKRVEAITGPGGVLWGANSYLGVVNVITKDAEDIDGVEVGGQIGDGNGDRKVARAYAMVGLPDLMQGKAKLFVHSAFETYQGPGLNMPLMMYNQPLPQPNAPNLYGPLTQAEPGQSYLFNFFAKATFGKFQVRVNAPIHHRKAALGFTGTVFREELPEDADPACTPDVPYSETDTCIDRGRRARNNRLDYLDRYAVAEYRTRTAGGKAGVGFRAYAVQFGRDMSINILAPIPILLEGGITVGFDGTTYRTGAAYDGDFELPSNLRFNYGAEAFREFAIDDTKRSLQGSGIEAVFAAPYRLDRLPLPCPREPDPAMMGAVRFVDGCPLTFAFSSSRTVAGVYANPQWRPNKKLIVDAGARLQVSPESLGTFGYPVTALFSGTAVYNFLPSWHLKLNYAQGFRPPVFSNLASNGEAVQIAGRPDLKVETSDAAQGEVNARIFKGSRRIRELSFRVDYAYTRLQNLIQIVGGRYDNTADRGIHSAEGLAKLYIQGGHRLELSYAFQRVATRDKGWQKAVPEHMFHLAGVFNLIDSRLQAYTDLRVVGATEDPNRLIEYRDYIYCEQLPATDMNPNGGCPSGVPLGSVVNASTGAFSPLRVTPSDLSLDRLPAAADLSLGLTYTPTEKLVVRGNVFNAFNARYYQPDTFYNHEPRLEFAPNPWEDWRVYVSAAYTY